MLCIVLLVFFFKQKTAYEMRISDWSSDVCSSDLPGEFLPRLVLLAMIGLLLMVGVTRSRHMVERQVESERARRNLSRHFSPHKIGRASCRERVCQYV